VSSFCGTKNHAESKCQEKKKLKEEAKDQVKQNYARGDRGSPGKQHWPPHGASNNFMKQMAMFTQFHYFQK
jgi:hypothetical protein